MAKSFEGAGSLAAGAAGAGLLAAGAAGYAGGLQVPAMQVMVLAGLAFAGSLALLKVMKKVEDFADFVCKGVEASQALNDTIQDGMKALAVLKDTAQYMQLELRSWRVEAVQKMMVIHDMMKAQYDRMDKCGNKLEVMQSLLVFS